MVKTVYLLVGDLHLSVANKDNRYSYRREMEHTKEQLVEIALKYHSAGYRVVFVFLGDLFDRGYRDCIGCTLDQNFFIALYQMFGKNYSVLGNHEITYRENNPFYTLMTKLESKRVAAYPAKGLLDVVSVPDVLIDGNLAIHFNHYGVTIAQPIPEKVNVGLFHQDICCNEILQDVYHTYGEQVFDKHVMKFKDAELFAGYQYCYFGHLHSVYGAYSVDTSQGSCKLQYLASLGRPQHNEVRDNFLERDIPALIVENGVFVREEHNFFNLQKRVDCIKESVVQKQQENRKELKAQRKAMDYSFVSDKPLENVRSALLTNTVAVGVLDAVVGQKPIPIADRLRQRVREVL